MEIEIKDSYIVYTDGACSGNPGRGGWASVILSPKGSVKEIGGYSQITTNNKMELTAVIEALKLINHNSNVIILTDSSYVLNGITKWIYGWRKNNWINSGGEAVANKELWEALLVETRKFKIDWRYSRGHIGIAGNERADEIAVNFSKNNFQDLYFGSASGYSHALLPLPEKVEIPSYGNNNNKTSMAKSDEKPYYISYSNGVLRTHKDWKTCEGSTKGISGAKFKKVKNQNEEFQTIKDWGLDLNKIKTIRS
jgi:ribonuclease HI